MEPRTNTIDKDANAFSPPSESLLGILLLKCLGRGEIVEPRAPEPLVRVRTGKPLALVVYLAFSPGRSATREHLVDRLWGDLDRSAGRASLRTALSYLRSRLGEGVLSADDHSCSLSASLRVDVQDFHAALSARDYRAALDLYTGDFLEQFASPGCQEFELWADLERSRLRALALRSAEAWCRASLDRGVVSEARHAARRAREIDPDSQVGWRLELEASMAAADLVATATTASLFEQWLSAGEREVEPASLAAIQRARSTRPPIEGPSDGRAPDSEMVGREVEFAAILDEWAIARRGQMRFVSVAGGPGLGKTKLLESVANRIRSRGEATLRIRAYHGERDVAGALLATLVYELAQRPGALGVDQAMIPFLLELDPRLAATFSSKPNPVPSRPSDLQLTKAVRELIGAVCDEEPLMLLLDDTQWMDEQSRHVLSAALARLDTHPVLVVAATRATESELSPPEHAQRVVLHPLGRADVEALMAGMGELPDPADCDPIVDHIALVSRGVPLLILEALQQMASDGVADVRQGRWHFERRLLQSELRRVDPLSARLRALPDDARSLIAGIAISGIPISRSTLAAFSAEIDPTSSSRIQELEKSGYLRDVGGGYVALHDAVADALTPMMGAEERRRLARAMGTRLIESGTGHDFDRGLRLLVDIGQPHLVAPAVTRLANSTAVRPSRVQLARRLNREPDDPAVEEVWKQLPLRVRIPAYRFLVAASLVAAIAAIALAAFLARTPAPTGVVLRLAGQGADGSALWAAARPEVAGWVTGIPIASQEAENGGTTPRAGFVPLVRPGTNAVAADGVFADTAGMDVFLKHPGGRSERLTTTSADESPLDWSPDGDLLAIQTDAFTTSGGKSLAVLDVRTGAIRPVGPVHGSIEGTSAWSPDGTRLATIYRYPDQTKRLCVIAIDGRTLGCRSVPDSVRTIATWSGESSLLVSAGSRQGLSTLEVESGVLSPPLLEGIEEVLVSPDRRWLAFSRNSPNRRIFIAPRTEPQRIREVTPPSGAWSAAVWEGSAIGDYLDTIRIAHPPAMKLGGVHQLEAVAKTNRGAPIHPRAVTWASLRPAIAAVDSTGVVTPLRSGTAVIVVSAGGWRGDTATFAVLESKDTVLHAEQWDRPFDQRWVPFGIPLPIIKHDPALGNVFVNNGDGNFFSGAYYTMAIPRGNGVVVEALMKTPITRRTHQYVQIGLITTQNLSRLRTRWDHRSGYVRPDVFGEQCVLSYPHTEAPDSRLRMEPFGRLRDVAGAAGIPEGQVYRVRIAFLPDGRCLMALNDAPAVITRLQGVLLDSVTVIIQGNSVRGDMAVGRLTITLGLPKDIDWSRARRRDGEHQRISTPN